MIWHFRVWGAHACRRRPASVIMHRGSWSVGNVDSVHRHPPILQCRGRMAVCPCKQGRSLFCQYRRHGSCVPAKQMHRSMPSPSTGTSLTVIKRQLSTQWTLWSPLLTPSLPVSVQWSCIFLALLTLLAWLVPKNIRCVWCLICLPQCRSPAISHWLPPLLVNKISHSLLGAITF